MSLNLVVRSKVTVGIQKIADPFCGFNIVAIKIFCFLKRNAELTTTK